MPLTILKLSCRTLATGAKQFVVHEAFEITLCFTGSYALSLTPSTTVRSGSLDGAEIMTFFTVPRRCVRALAPLVKCPVASITICAPTDDQLISAGSLILKTLVDLPSTLIESTPAVTAFGRFPRIESYFRRYARVLGSVTSFTATISMEESPSEARKMFRPIRPNPLIPTLTGILLSDLYEVGITFVGKTKACCTTMAAEVKPNFSVTTRNQYPPNSSVRISSSSTPAFVSISRIAATMAGGPAT